MLRRLSTVAPRRALPSIAPACARPLYTRSPPPPSRIAHPLASKPAPARTLATGLSQDSTPIPPSSVFAATDDLLRRHVGPQPASVRRMLDFLGYESLDSFVDDCVPGQIRLPEGAVDDSGADGIRALSESELLKRARELGRKNKVATNFIGLGYHQAVRALTDSGCDEVLSVFGIPRAGSSPGHLAQHARESLLVLAVLALSGVLLTAGSARGVRDER